MDAARTTVFDHWVSKSEHSKMMLIVLAEFDLFENVHILLKNCFVENYKIITLIRTSIYDHTHKHIGHSYKGNLSQKAITCIANRDHNSKEFTKIHKNLQCPHICVNVGDSSGIIIFITYTHTHIPYLPLLQVLSDLLRCIALNWL